ncbi:related to tRNA (guanosine(18)-2'-O)-methyltransferase [Zygosaccharomyces bailii ISA1307]|nr:related to tRNA (guanosine(18)-2'-O)-methyltransferase [Zygosaccharomyces bailii ISA1307]
MLASASGDALIRNYLDDNELIRILSNLIKEDQLAQVLDVLNIISVDLSEHKDIVEQLFKRVTSKLIQQIDYLTSNPYEEYTDGFYNELLANKELRVIGQLMCQLKPLETQLETWIGELLAGYVASDHEKLFERDLYDTFSFTLIANSSGGELKPEINVASAVFLVKFLEVVYSLEEGSPAIAVNGGNIYTIILSLLGCNIETLAFSASFLLRWKIACIADRCMNDEDFDLLTWAIVKAFHRSGCDRVCKDWKLRDGLILILRFLLVSKASPQLMSYIKSDDYWQTIQHALAHDVHEYRKLGISVLRITVDRLTFTSSFFATATFTWDPKDERKNVKLWDQFTTLYEIVALEPALNQIEAATDQILNLFSHPYLHPTWSLILFSTGLKATMESVRKYMISLLFKIEDRSVFSTDLTTLKRTFLPAILEAQYFVVQNSSCPYGERLSTFISAVIAEDKQHPQAVISTALELLVEQPTIFDPSRVYLTFGILNSLKRKHSRLIVPHHLELIERLFDVQSEEEIVETTLQTMNLKFLLHVHPSVSPYMWIRALVAHIKNGKNGYRFINALTDDLRDFAVAFFDYREIEQQFGKYVNIDVTFDLLSLVLLEYPYVRTEALLIIEMSKWGVSREQYNNEATKLLSGLLTGERDDEEYNDAHFLVNYPAFGYTTWKSVRMEELYSSLLKQFSKNKFEFFVRVYQKGFENDAYLPDLRWSDVKDLYRIIKLHLVKERDFKIRDEVYGTYMRFLCSFLKVCALDWVKGKDDNELNQLLSLLHENVSNDNGTFLGNLYVSKLCKYILDSYIVISAGVTDEVQWDLVLRLIDILSVIWDDVFSKRLILIQKDLHTSLIEAFFHPTLLFFASEHSSAGDELAEVILKRGQDLLDQSSTRRGYLPLLARNIRSFVVFHSKKCKNSDDGPWWLIYLMLGTFTSTQLSINVFFLRPIIADLFDRKINTYHENDKTLYEQVYGPEEISAKILIIDAFLQCTTHLKEQVFIQTAKRSNLLYAIKETDGAEETQRILQFELLLLGIRSYDKKLLFDFVKDSLLPSLSSERSPLVRIYKEWFTAFCVAEFYEEENASVIEDIVFSSINDHSKPAFTTSNERIAFLVLEGLTNLKNICPQRLLKRFMGAVISSATTNKPLIRHFSNSLMFSFWHKFAQFITNDVLKEIVYQMYLDAKELQLPGQYRVGDANTWDIYQDLTLTGIFGGVLKKTTSASIPFFSEALFKKYLSCEVKWPIGSDDTSMWLNRCTNQAPKASDITFDASSQLQMKSGAWKMLMDIDGVNSEKTVDRSDLVVVASLVDKAPNLGGICRLCDVLGVGLLTVPSISVKKNPQFKNVAVTADRWMPLEELQPKDIAAFMKCKKKEGYTLIGLEQTDKSVQLDDHYKFPQKTLILLGTEAYGIPGPLLSELDLCLEIKQFGVVRSMNIQTATAVIVHSYTVQHM